MWPMPFEAPSSQLLRELGISRLARVTTLDRSPVEVVGAIRPRGHVLQVTQGKGLDLRHAEWSAVGEAAELTAAETVDPSRLVFGTGAALEGHVLDDDGLARAWIRGLRVSDRAAVWVPAERVYCPPAGAPWLGPSASRWTSNGLGAHQTRAAAIEHAILELWERHALATVLPAAWSPATLAAGLADYRTGLTEAFARRGFLVAPVMLARRPLPLAGVLLFDLEDPAVPLTAGYACRPTMASALEAALLEAAQSRLTEIHGARDDVAVGHRVESQALLEATQRARSQRGVPGDSVRGWPRSVSTKTIVVPLRDRPLHVVKAIGIGLEETELLR
jgi:ribosomal protein S12 methylthiotransferase accessory factor